MLKKRFMAWFPSMFLMAACACHQQEPPEPQSPGLAVLRYAGTQFENFYAAAVQNSLDYKLQAGKPRFIECTRGQNQTWALVLRGRLDVPQAGTYAFQGFGDEGMVRLNGAWFPLDGERELSLPQGRLSFELFQRTRSWSCPPLSAKLLWRVPGAASFAPIPPEALSHGAGDLADHAPLRPDAPVTDLKLSTSGVLSGSFEIPEDGFYRLLIRVGGGNLRWGCPSGTASLDGAPLFKLPAPGMKTGFFDEIPLTRFLEAGRHTLEFEGATDKFLTYPALRLGLFRVDGADDATLSITEAVPGETVFRKGEPFVWNFERATGPALATYQVKVWRQRASDKRPLWSGSATLPANRARAVGVISYPCPEEGAFEYQILDGQGNILEGPWEFVVVDPTPPPTPKLDSGVLVDSIDCADTGHQFRDNGTSAVVSGYRKTGPKSLHQVYEEVVKGKEYVKRPENYKDAKGRIRGVFDQDWFAYTLKPQHPEKAHLIVAWLPTDQYRRIAIQAFDPVTGFQNGSMMEVEPSSDGKLVKLAFPFWPNCQAIDVTTAAVRARHGRIGTESAIAKIELYEYPDGFPPLPEAACGWNPGRLAGWGGEQLNLGVEVSATPRLQDEWIFAKDKPGKTRGFWRYHDYKALWQAWDRFGQYSRWRGDNLLVWPVHTYEMAHLKTKRLFWGAEAFASGYGQRPVDKHRRDNLKLILLLCEKHGVNFVADFQINRGPTPELLKFIAEAEGAKSEDCQDLFLEGGGQHPSRVLDPSQPVARSFLVHFYGDIARQYADCKALKGINLRQLPWSSMVSAWFAGHDVGYGDGTIGRFEHDTGLQVPAGDYEARYAFLVKDPKNRAVWFKWRADQVFSLRQEILAEIRKAAPHMRLFATGADCRTDGALGDGLDMRLASDPALGFDKKAEYGIPGVEVNTLDPFTYRNFDVRKGALKLSPEERLATSPGYPDYPEYPVGLCSGTGLSSPPSTTKQLALALAAGPLDQIIQGGLWVLPATDDTLRRWGQTWRAIPSLDFHRSSAANAELAFWTDGKGVSYLVNTTASPKTARLKADAATDMVSGQAVDPRAVEVPAYGLRLLRHSGPATLAEAPRVPAFSLLVKNSGGLERKGSLAVVKLADLLARLPEGAAADSLRVADGGKFIPVQADVPEGELCFQMSFAAGEDSRTVELSLGGPSPWPNHFAVGKDAGKLLVRDGGFTAGFGPGLCLLEDRGVKVWSGSALMPFPWPEPLGAPRLLAAGPVRALVECESPRPVDIEWNLERNPVSLYFHNAFLRDATHKVTFEIAAGVPAVHFRDRYAYAAALVKTFNSSTGWQDLTRFGGAKEDKVAYFFDGVPKTATLQKKDGFGIRKNGGWAAVWDTKVGRGLGVAVPPQPLCALVLGGALAVCYHGEVPAAGLDIDRWAFAMAGEGKVEPAAVSRPLEVEILQQGGGK